MSDLRRRAGADAGGAPAQERAVSIPQGVARVNGMGIITYVDGYTAKIFGCTREEILGRHFAEFNVEEEQALAVANFEQRRLGIGGVTEYRMRRKNGAVFWVMLATAPTVDADGAFLGVTCFITDIDERKRQQEMSAHEHRLLRQIAGNYPLASVLEDLCVTLEAISRRQLLASVMLAEGNTLRCVAAPSLSARFRQDRAAVCLDADASPCAQAVRSGCEIIVGDTVRAEATECCDYGFGAVWSYPVIQNEETLGTLALFLPAPGEPDAEDARAIAFALQVARLALAHERTTRALRESEQRFRDFAELSADWFWEQDADLRFSSVVGGAQNNRKSIITNADIIGRTRWELPVTVADTAAMMAHRAQQERREAFANFEYALRGNDGSLRWIAATGKPVFAADGAFLGYRGTSRDITDRRRAQEALQTSEQRFRDYADMAADWFWEQDGEFRFTEVSYGSSSHPMEHPTYYHEQSVGKHRWELPYENVPEGFWEEHHRLLKAGQPFDNLRLQRRDGEVVRHVELSGHPLFDGHGRLIGYRGIGRDITDQVRAREKLEKTLRWLEQAVRAAGVGLWERDIGTWAFSFRDNWRALFGYAGDELKDTAEEFDRLVHPDDLQRIHVAARAYTQGPSREYEIRFRIRHKDGSWRWVLSRGNVMPEPATGRRVFVGCHLDITEQVIAREELEKSLLRLKQAVGSASIGLWECDLDAQTVSFAESWNTLFGYAEGEVDGTVANFVGLIHPDDLDVLRHFGRDYLENMSDEVEHRFRLRHKNGSWRWALVRGNVMTDAGTGRRIWMGCHIDITKQIEAEQKISELATMLEVRVNARTAELEEANRELDAFNYSVTHDLRTPLRAIEGFSKALLEDCEEQIDQAGRDYLRRICRSTVRMGELIDALYELSRMSRSPLRLGTVDLSAMAREIVADLRAQDPQRAVDIEISGTPLVEGDARLLRIVLVNLLGNAWKFTGNTVPARIVFEARRDDKGRAVYTLRDNGAGFDMQFADKLFRIFHRLHRDEEFPGQGVGLTTVQRIIARHGGRIRAESAGRDTGATFRFTLWNDPALLAEAREAPDSA